ncbi:MarR family winged helix-turn-helix transcriptional regulator [Mycobacterium sp. NAZ190054]|uniref:MarR family winged helix-turn-helix transcriptional regulator n=1 Tax=Mycobacterium sp. NAZ190054 TaxID=1747766 RepID=UPI000799E8C0|nr:MarR family transcriptional regulator [Mycobacterium sp. NAZ190054]KWX57068.1 MarR family transcriptional regulator [Mycobacterium sp. NAZ190054]
MDSQPGTAVLMYIAHREVERRVMEALARSGADDVTIAQSRLMQRLDPAGMRLTDLAEQARVTKQTAGALVDQLERAGYVTRRPDAADARARLVTLTDKGAEMCRRAGAEVDRVEREWRKHLGDAAFDGMRAALLSLREITDPYR